MWGIRLGRRGGEGKEGLSIECREGRGIGGYCRVDLLGVIVTEGTNGINDGGKLRVFADSSRHA